MTPPAPIEMKASSRRWLLPLVVFILAFALHALYVRHVARLPVQGWADTGIVDDRFLGLRPYLAARDYLTGYSYALPLAFAAIALRRYRECRRRQNCPAGNVAVGGITLSGFLAGSGCFLSGCCGSPMLGIYLSLFGPSFLPMVKPLVAGVTTVMVGFSYYWWIWRRGRNEASVSTRQDCPTSSDCDCSTGSAKITP
jgi:hypothetical protein